MTGHDVRDLGICTTVSKAVPFSIIEEFYQPRLIELRKVPSGHGFGLYGVDEASDLTIVQLGIDAKGDFRLAWDPGGWQPDWLIAAENQEAAI